ncbi:AraC family transcriptional regulator [Stenotrophomonas sp. SY1]|jgi:AraC-like DNA-binding protein|uniref:helix-turn-helix transcriptional regulator n=1 Tax=Stenotrophomonas sp. SY1 TaxID=477235 RepID=UPI001E60C52F|nr:AraC family transcriptional regulator [Stenotrophomonas sp. SY1]MCD9086656.1 AraC family transcriptional regulator [Stenotrophomonas sp. SY1]
MPSTFRHLRRYPAPTGLERHDYAQWVLPVRGDLQFEVGGRGGRLDLLQGAFVAPGESHDLEGQGENCCLIIDCHPGALDDDTLEHLRQQRWLALPKHIRQQLQHIHAQDAEADPLPQLLRYFAPAGSGARLQALCAAIRQCPGADWSVARMAAQVGVSGSRLHALFAHEFDVSPQAWLGAARLRWAKQELLRGDASISDIALRAGYSEHSALTRALRRESGLSPSQWRRQGSSLGQDTSVTPA